MIFAHAIIGLLPVDHSNLSLYWFVGSIAPDIDHLFVLYKHKIFSARKIAEAMRFEERYGVHFKTKFVHSIAGALLSSLPVFLLNVKGGLFYLTGYLLHLVLDIPDTDLKQYFYPLKKTFRGPLPVLSSFEIVFTVVLLVGYLYTIVR